MGKTFQAATTNTWELFDHKSLLQIFFLISAKLNFHRPLVCSTICHVQYYTAEVGGSSVWQISKKILCRSDLWSKSSHVSVVAAWNVFSIHSLIYTQSLACTFFWVWQRSAWNKSAALKSFITKNEWVNVLLYSCSKNCWIILKMPMSENRICRNQSIYDHL